MILKEFKICAVLLLVFWKKKFLIPLIVLSFFPTAQALDDNSATLTNDSARCEEFMDWGAGMFIHWSLDSELGSVISHSMVGASEDYLYRYINELPKCFNPKSYDAEEWVKLAKLAGFKYMVLTTKHHSGFCLWPTQSTEFSVANTPYKKDIVKQYVDACRKYDMKVGFYFSPEDFLFLHKQGYEIRRRSEHANISSNPELLAHNKIQVKELFSNYGAIDVAFLDAFDNKLIAQYIHQLQPKCLITRGEMETPEQHIPDKPMKGPWESCFTLGTQWQYKPTNENYKSGRKLIEMLIDVRAKGETDLARDSRHGALFRLTGERTPTHTPSRGVRGIASSTPLGACLSSSPSCARPGPLRSGRPCRSSGAAARETGFRRSATHRCRSS